MVSIDEYKNLVEISELDNKINHYVKKIEGHKDRVVQITLQEKQKQKQLLKIEEEFKETKQKLVTSERKLAEVVKNHEKSKLNIKVVNSEKQLKALEKEVETLLKKKNILEENILVCMEKIEEFESEITVIQSFLRGVKESILEIEKEVSVEILREQEEIAKVESTIELKISEIPQSLKERFKSIRNIFRFKSPLAHIVNNSCDQCHMRINLQDQINLDKCVSIERCPGCNRIFLPSPFNP